MGSSGGRISAKALYVLVALIVLVLVGGVTSMFSRLGDNIERQMAKEFNEQQLALGQHMKFHLKDNMDSAGIFLGAVIREQEVMEVAKLVGEKGSIENREEVRDFISSKVKTTLFENPYYVRFAIIGKDGNLIIYFDKSGEDILVGGSGKDILYPEGAYLLKGAKPSVEKAAFFKTHTVSLGSGENSQKVKVIDASRPIIYDGMLVGWAVLSIDMKMIEDILSLPYKKERKHAWIFDNSGKLVFCSLILSQASHDIEIDVLMGSRPGTYELVDHENGEVELFSTVPMVIGENLWTLVVESSFAETVGIVHYLQKVRTLIVFLIMVVVALGGFFLYRWMAALLMAKEKGMLLDEITASEKKFRQVFELSLNPMLLLGPDLKVLDINEATVETLEIPREKLLGESLEKFIAEKDEFEKVMKSIAETDESSGLQLTFEKENGEKLYFINTMAAVRDEKGGVKYFQSYLHNLTAQKEFEFKLQQEKKQLESILESIGAAMAIFNRDRSIFWSNNIYKEMAREDYFSELDCCLSGKPSKVRDIDCPILKTLETGEGVRTEKEVTDNDGRQHCFFITTTPIKSISGDIVRVMELIIDISKTKTLELQLLHSEKLAAIGELAAGVAHELNNPMAGILGYSEFLMEGIKDPVVRQDAERIHHEATRCSKIIQNLLTFARQHQPKENKVMLNFVLDTTVDMVEYEFRVQNISITKDYEQALNEISGDAFQLQQVFLNILNNAFFYLKEHEGPGNVWIKTQNTAKGVRVDIENDGPRFNEDITQKIFEPFFTTKEVGVGTGLGLSISHGIVKSHQGEISATNTERGIVFTIDFPSKTEP